MKKSVAGTWVGALVLAFGLLLSGGVAAAGTPDSSIQGNGCITSETVNC
jgi:hypothetical protein